MTRNIDCIIVGCGLSGSVIARFLAEELNKRVLIWERRDHIAGNMYDFREEHNILVHRYGPHTFHTTKKYLYDYICRFSEWDSFYLKCMSSIDDKFTPTPFNYQTIDDFFPKKKALLLKQHLEKAFYGRDRATIVELLNHPDSLINEFATFLFEKDYKLYTAKQWGVSPAEIDKSVLNRVPVLLSYKNQYFNDSYQVLPRHGYTDFFVSLLDHPNINVKLGIDALHHLRVDSINNKIQIDGISTNIPIIYTGALDELFKGTSDALPYRSLQFKWKYEKVNSFQDAPVVAYPQAENFTRITEYKKLPVQVTEGTTYAVEYPLAYDKGNKSSEPYYPVLTAQSQELYSRYKMKADRISNLYYCGRLADFKYYNMDQALERAMELCETLRSKLG